MKVHFLVIILSFTLNACGQNNQSSFENEQNTFIKMNTNQNNNPKEVVKSLISAMAENDAVKIRSLFHQDAKQAYGEGGEWKSGQKFFSWLESDIIDRKGHVDNATFETNGNEVVVKGQYSSRGYTNKANFLFVVDGDKIMSWQMRY